MGMGAVKYVETKNKIIFLDVDGALNSGDFYIWLGDHHERKYRGYELLDQKAILCLQDIVLLTGADIVLSSSWRISRSCMKRLEEQLLPYDLKIVDRTVSMPHEDRGSEIKEWLNRHPYVTNFVILDDDDDMGDLGDHLVKTSFRSGLLPGDTTRAIRILTSDIPINR